MTNAFLRMTGPRGHKETEREVTLRKHRAFDLVYPRCRRIVSGVCLKNQINPSDHEDILQQTLLDLFRAIEGDEFDGNCTLFTFVYMIAQRRCVDQIRRQVRRGEAEASERDRESVAGDLETSACAKAALRDVGAAHPRSFEVFLLLAIGNMTAAEAAEALGVSAAWLRNILVGVRKTIRKACMEHCGVQDCTEARAA